MPYLFTSESVSEGHPDKVADQISDGVLDEYLKYDPNAKVACETFVTTGLVVIGGEIKTTAEAKAKVDVQEVARRVINDIGYTKSEYKFDGDSCGVITTLHEQSADINRGVERGKDEEQGAGDQGMMFGYAVNETRNFMPLALEISHMILKELQKVRRTGLPKKMHYLRPDAKSQVTIEYNDRGKPVRIDSVVISTQHDDWIKPEKDTDQSREMANMMMTKQITQDMIEYIMPKVRARFPYKMKKYFKTNIKFHINPTGSFVIGGPHGDTGLTGRKIIVDTYGGRAPHGGGAFSGKDSSKVDRSAAYACRHIAKNIVASGLASECLVQVAYAIGVAEPVGLYVNTFYSCKVKKSNGKKYSDTEISNIVKGIFDMRPGAIVKRFGLKNPIFLPSASYGHMGRKPEMLKVEYKGDRGGKLFKEFETFTWEKLDYVEKIKEVFGFRHGYKGYVKKEFAPNVSGEIYPTSEKGVRSYSNYQPKSSSGPGKRGRPRKVVPSVDTPSVETPSTPATDTPQQ